jgi:hypothetical protein
MGRKVVVDVTEIGRLGGQATAANRTAKERLDASRKAIKARWDAYYVAHPEKLKAKRERAQAAEGESGEIRSGRRRPR